MRFAVYLKKKSQLGDKTCKHISQLLVEVKEIHRQDRAKNPTLTLIWHERAKKYNFYLRGFKYLLIMRKTTKQLNAKITIQKEEENGR